VVISFTPVDDQNKVLGCFDTSGLWYDEHVFNLTETTLTTSLLHVAKVGMTQRLDPGAFDERFSAACRDSDHACDVQN